MHQKPKPTQRIKILAAIAGIFAALLILGIAFFGNFIPGRDSKASGVTPTITPSTQNVSTSANISLQFNTSANIPTGTIIEFSYPDTYSGTLSTVNTTINGIAPSAVSNSTSGGITTSSLTTANPTITTGSSVTILTSALTTPVSAGNYAFGVKTNVDSGANFQYVGEANVVEVRAYVPVSLSFAIRNTADTANTNVCDLGTASTSAISTCNYRLKIGTNATGGYTVSMQADGNLSNGSHNITNAAAGAGGSGGTLISAGTERYGVVINPGSITATGGTITVASLFDAGGTNSVLYNYTTPQVILTANKPNAPAPSADTTNTSLITHNLGIEGSTPSGFYTQRITYTVAPAF